MNKALIILGPTAVGKSELAIKLAKQVNAEIISADSMQVYRGMDIGTAKPTLKERQGIPHHLIDIRNPDEEWTVSDFVEQTNQLTNEIAGRGRLPIIVGGTGLYLWTLLEGYSFPLAPADKTIRQKLEKKDLAKLYSKLKEVDPQAAEKIHPNDKKRIIRALEVYELTGYPISKLQRTQNSALRTPHSTLIGITMPREELYRRIEERVDQMVENGLIDEVKGLLAKGYAKDLPSFQALGYKEVIEYLDGKWPKEKMIEELKKRTRHFARRQMTWFKRFSAKGGSASGGNNVKWFDAPVDSKAVLAYINSI
ncbi:MAG: tRNA (adenosine(37)-N6)-dimethylallyltransferase MiaA [Candidatus Margulisiibacteriota bacterium]